MAGRITFLWLALGAYGTHTFFSADNLYMVIAGLIFAFAGFSVYHHDIMEDIQDE